MSQTGDNLWVQKLKSAPYCAHWMLAGKTNNNNTRCLPPAARTQANQRAGNDGASNAADASARTQNTVQNAK